MSAASTKKSGLDALDGAEITLTTRWFKVSAGLNENEQKVLLILYLHARRDERLGVVCFPSQAKLAEEAETSERTVERAIRTLRPADKNDGKYIRHMYRNIQFAADKPPATSLYVLPEPEHLGLKRNMLPIEVTLTSNGKGGWIMRYGNPGDKAGEEDQPDKVPTQSPLDWVRAELAKISGFPARHDEWFLSEVKKRAEDSRRRLNVVDDNKRIMGLYRWAFRTALHEYHEGKLLPPGHPRDKAWQKPAAEINRRMPSGKPRKLQSLDQARRTVARNLAEEWNCEDGMIKEVIEDLDREYQREKFLSLLPPPDTYWTLYQKLLDTTMRHRVPAGSTVNMRENGAS